MYKSKEWIPELLIGMQVSHVKWGIGEIREIEKSYIYVVFSDSERHFQFPDSMDKFLKVVNEELYHRLYIKYKNQNIVERLEERKIKRFLHFTKVNNLDSILQNGLMSVKHLEELDIQTENNDSQRLDNRRDATSLSISFPNYQMFFSCRNENPNAKWVIISYNAAQVASMDCAYFAENAASHNFSDKNWEDLVTAEAFDALFEGNRPDLHSYETTNPQAEVMVRGVIPAECVEGLIFDDFVLLQEYQKKYPNIKMVLNREYYAPRRDYERWKKQNG